MEFDDRCSFFTTLLLLNPLFVQLKHTNYYKIVKQLKSFKIVIVAPAYFGLHTPSSGSYSLCLALAKHRLRAGLCKLKHVGATVVILNDFNSLAIL